MPICGFSLSVDGCPYRFDTGGCPTPTSSDADWSLAWTGVDGGLVFEGWSWDERARSDGTYDAGGLSFKIVDKVVTTGEAAGQRVASWLFTRRPAWIARTRLTASLDDNDLTLNVEDVTALGITGYPTVVYLEREAIRVGSATGTTQLNATWRGDYGSLAVAHDVDTAELRQPTVWAGYPSVTRRRVILWAVDETGAATPLWRGVCGRAPRLVPLGGAGGGMQLELDCEPIWSLYAPMQVGHPAAVCTLGGYWGSECWLQVRIDGAPVVGGGGGAHYRDLESMCRGLRENTIATLAQANVPINDATVRVEPFGAGVRASVTLGGTGSTVELVLNFGDQTATGAGGTYAVATIPRVPSAIIHGENGRADVTYQVDNVADLPSTYAPAGPYEDAGYETTIAPTLRGEGPDETWVALEASEHGATGATSTGFYPEPWVRGRLRVEPRDGAAAPPGRTPRTFTVLGEVRMRVGTTVRTGHFAAGLKRILDNSASFLRSRVNPRDWAWTYDAGVLRRVIAATASQFAPRQWDLDGGQTVGELLRELCAVNGLALCTRASRIAVAPVGPPTASADVAATIGEADLAVGGAHGWEALAEEQITGVRAEGEGLNLTVYDRTAIGTYGDGRTIAVKLAGQREALASRASFRAFADYLLSRIQGTYAEPIAALAITVPASRFATSVFVGDYVDVSEWLAPDGAGGRGIGSAASLAAFAEATSRAQVVGWAVDWGRNHLTLTLLLFNQVYGYAPALRVDGSPTTDTIEAAVQWLNGAGDYTDPDDGATDGGASRFVAGDRVRLVRRDATTETVEDKVVLSVVGIAVMFTTALDAANRASINAGDWWDLVPSPYSTAGLQDAQKAYAYVGSRSAGVIGGTSTPNRPWSP